MAKISLDKYSGFINTINSDSNSNLKEESLTKKKREDPAENENHICPNPICGKNFANPIKVENVGNGTIYEACPYCLTELIVEKPVSISAAGPKIPQEEKSEAEEKPLAKKKLETQIVPEKTECKHYFGYLSKRSSKESVPEECIVCEKIVQCMLKTITE